jgi:predicted nucleic acid-binding protein
MKGKYVLCDASSLISLTSSCLEHTLYFFHDSFGVKFFIPQSVEEEVVKRPLSLRSKIHCFSALRIKDMINDGIVEVVSESMAQETKRLMELGNKIFYARGKPVNIIHEGETEMLALAGKLQIESLLMDERTTRILVEDPGAMKDHLQKEFDATIMVNRNALSQFLSSIGSMEVIRSTELLYLAYEKGFLDSFQGIAAEAAEAALYKLKYSGCAISFHELEEYSGMMHRE